MSVNCLHVRSWWIFGTRIREHGWMWSLLLSRNVLSFLCVCFCVCVRLCVCVCVCVCVYEVVWVTLWACLKRCCLRLVCFWCRWVGVTLKTFPASLTLSLSSTQTCHSILHLRVSGVLGKKKKKTEQEESFLQPSRYLEERCELAGHVHTKRKTSALDTFPSDRLHVNLSRSCKDVSSSKRHAE